MPSTTQSVYAAPSVTDYGTLREWTGSHHLFIGKQVLAAAAALSVVKPPGGVSPSSGSGVTGSGVIQAVASTAHPTTPGVVHGVTNHGTTSPAGLPGVVGGVNNVGGAGSGGGGTLPFTGFTTILAASVGAGLMSAGAWLRWATRRGPRPNTPL